jgi:uncharacterized UPF0160 family protein
MKKVATHNGKFHADEVFALATLKLAYASGIEVCRTRDEVVIATADYVVDVGSVYDEEKNRFDHHQEKGAGKRKNGIPYASFGLVWKKYGLIVCGSQAVADNVDRELVQPIDANDNGIDIFKLTRQKIPPFTVSSVIHFLNSTWKEDDVRQDEAFIEALEFAKKVLSRMITVTKDKYEAIKFVEEAYVQARDKRVIVLDENYPAREVLARYPEPLYIVRPRKAESRWGVETVKDDPYSFKNRRDFPKEWGGKKGAELQKITGIADAWWCHRNLFLATAESKEGAVALAYKALE